MTASTVQPPKWYDPAAINAMTSHFLGTEDSIGVVQVFTCEELEVRAWRSPQSTRSISAPSQTPVAYMMLRWALGDHPHAARMAADLEARFAAEVLCSLPARWAITVADVQWWALEAAAEVESHP
jgi:hypothetical protein